MDKHLQKNQSKTQGKDYETRNYFTGKTRR